MGTGSTDKLGLLDWQYYWHYRLQVFLDHDDPHGWVFYALWIFNGLILIGLLFLGSAYLDPLAAIFENRSIGLVLLNACVVVSAISVTRLIYGNASRREEVIRITNSYEVRKPYVWFEIAYPLFAVSFCWLMFFLAGEIRY